MAFSVYQDKRNRNGDRNGYNLPNSIRWLTDCQDSSMKYNGSPTLSHVKIVEILIHGEEYRLPYKLFIGVMPTNRDSKIIIVGEYLVDDPYEYGSFCHIEVPNSEMFDFVCDSDREPFDILHLENNTYAILLKTGIIIIGITPAFQKYLDENLQFDDGNYNNSYLYVERFNFVRDITDSPFNRSSIDCCDLRFDETMNSSLEKNDGGSRISLDFTRTCMCSDDDCLTNLHWKTENHIWIDISNEKIRIQYTRCTTTYDSYILDGHFNDHPRIQTDEKDDNFRHKITYDRFPEDKSEEDDS
jgi:hypothetical protein